ncbi:MAG: peptide deformylase [Phycisphaerales bacterium]|nr:peptide deformylase [Phycisphaerales bacterium]
MRHLVLHPKPVLRCRADPIDSIDSAIETLAAQMIEIMKKEHGIGLAAPQVGVSKRMFVTEGVAVDGSEEVPSPDRVFINPTILLVDGQLEALEEGCLSLPDIRGSVRRQPHVIIEATGLDGKRFMLESSDLMARCWQHEIDHLDGVLIIDRMSVIDRIVNRKRLRALERCGGED